MNVHVLYATLEGQTGKIARFVAERAEAAGHAVTTVDVGEPLAEVDLTGAGAVILAAPVHERRHPQPFEVVVRASREALQARPTLLISVSLKAAFESGLAEAEEYLSDMLMRTGFEPDRTLLVAGAVRAGAYDYFQSQVLRHVVLDGQDVDPGAGAREFTDWDRLAADLDDFLAGAASPDR